nr:MAG TPA: hypothetical protein [Caudoviricetes sp.]
MYVLVIPSAFLTFVKIAASAILNHPFLLILLYQLYKAVSVNDSTVNTHDSLCSVIFVIPINLGLDTKIIACVQDVVRRIEQERNDLVLCRCAFVVAVHVVAAQDNVTPHEGAFCFAVDAVVDTCNRLSYAVHHSDKRHKGLFGHEPLRAGFVLLRNHCFHVTQCLVCEVLCGTSGNLNLCVRGGYFVCIVQNAFRVAGAAVVSRNDLAFNRLYHSFGNLLYKQLFESGNCLYCNFLCHADFTTQLESTKDDCTKGALCLYSGALSFSNPRSGRLHAVDRDFLTDRKAALCQQREDHTHSVNLFQNFLDQIFRNRVRSVGGCGCCPHFRRNFPAEGDIVCKCNTLFQISLCAAGYNCGTCAVRCQRLHAFCIVLCAVVVLCVVVLCVVVLCVGILIVQLCQLSLCIVQFLQNLFQSFTQCPNFVHIFGLLHLVTNFLCLLFLCTDQIFKILFHSLHTSKQNFDFFFFQFDLIGIHRFSTLLSYTVQRLTGILQCLFIACLYVSFFVCWKSHRRNFNNRVNCPNVSGGFVCVQILPRILTNRKHEGHACNIAPLNGRIQCFCFGIVFNIQIDTNFHTVFVQAKLHRGILIISPTTCQRNFACVVVDQKSNVRKIRFVQCTPINDFKKIKEICFGFIHDRGSCDDCPVFVVLFCTDFKRVISTDHFFSFLHCQHLLNHSQADSHLQFPHQHNSMIAFAFRSVLEAAAIQT